MKRTKTYSVYELGCPSDMYLYSENATTNSEAREKLMKHEIWKYASYVKVCDKYGNERKRYTPKEIYEKW